MTPEQQEQLSREVEFANMGKQVLNNEAYKQAMTARRAQIFEAFTSTTKDQVEIREECWLTMKNLDALEEYFRVLLETGKMAEKTLESQ